MRYIVLALALCFALSPLEAAPKFANTHSANTHGVKPKKSKVKAHKPPKVKSHARTRAN
jgi:hypothetical protein